MGRDENSIEAALVDDVNRSRDAYESAKAEFQRIASRYPTGPSNMETNALLGAAISKRTRALTEYYAAVGELIEYLLDRKIPERFSDQY
jgi:hypothetical protein